MTDEIKAQSNAESVVKVNISAIKVSERIRAEMGNIGELAANIREYGLIQPIVLDGEYRDEPVPDVHNIKLVAGGRRLAAVKHLGWAELRHGIDFVWLSEKNKDPLRRIAVELEENLRRKELTWQEQVEGKRLLLETMQKIHGAPQMGRPTKAEALREAGTGFGVNKLAAMLGESPATTSKDLQVAELIKQVPTLAKSDTKESALRKLSIVSAVASMKAAAKINPLTGTKLWTLHEGDLNNTSSAVADKSVDFIYTDLPFGVGLNKMSKHATGPIGYADLREGILDLLPRIAAESYRVLCDNRYAMFFFGFNYYSRLVEELNIAGFSVHPVPVVWNKNTRSTENPNTHYANAYDAALVVSKGSPVFIRPGQTNLVDFPAVTSGTKLQIAQQPVALVQRFILDTTSEGAVVLDWCAGSGTTGEAAVRLKRRVILFEKEPAACSIIKARLGAL